MHHFSKSNSFIIRQVVSLKELIYVTNSHIKDPRVMMTVKIGASIFSRLVTYFTYQGHHVYSNLNDNHIGGSKGELAYNGYFCDVY